MDRHGIDDLLCAGEQRSVACNCGWSGHVWGSRSDALDLWASHVNESEFALA